MNRAAKIFLLRQLAMTLMTLAGRGVSFDLSRPLRQQAQGFFDGLGQLFFDVAQMLFGVREDHFQTRVHVFEPSLDFDLCQLGFGQAGRLCGRSGFGRSGRHDFFG